MAKLKNPLLSLDAVRRLGSGLTFRKSRGVHIAEKTPVPEDPRSLAQLSWRHMYQKAVALWHALSAAEKQDWESLARRRHMTGFAWFMSQALKPNPGLYLPLQGGTMTGDIDMAKNRLLKLPLPTDSQEPLTLAYYTANIAPYLYNQQARVWHTTWQDIPTGAWTALTFDSQRYDTDAIHDLVLNPSRLTAKTAGTYAISFCAAWAADATQTGYRQTAIRLNGATFIAQNRVDNIGPTAVYMLVSTQYHLALNDFVEALALQTLGIPIRIVSLGNRSPEFMMARIGQ